MNSDIIIGEGNNLFDDCGIPTSSSQEQVSVEEAVTRVLELALKQRSNLGHVSLLRDLHVPYLKEGLMHLPAGFSCLDASRPWLIYWALHSLELLDIQLREEEYCHIINFLKKCQSPNGGFGGGPQQYPHLAPTYAAVSALVVIGSEEAYNAINRKTLANFLWRMKTDEGSFTMHETGEVDIRGVYCAVSVAKLTNIWSKELFANTAEWISSCQTYEGGYAGAPGLEAHGGYTFCGLAALILLDSSHMCDVDSLLRWVVNRQMNYEGGFQGRTNKLVDGCYSFWQGGLFPIVERILAKRDPENLSAENWLFNQRALQEYLLLCCQYSQGGLLDKPGKAPDFYHTCYTLSGMSVAQHFDSGSLHRKCIIGNPNNELNLTHPLFNVGIQAYIDASQYFNKIPVPKLERE